MIQIEYPQPHAWLPTPEETNLIMSTIESLGITSLSVGRIECSFIDSLHSQNLNREHRGKDAPTDVLSFGYFHGNILPSEHELLGEILLCEEIVEKQALQYNHSQKAETLRLIGHGILHVLGLDHETDRDYEYFLSIEKKLFLYFPQILIETRYE